MFTYPGNAASKNEGNPAMGINPLLPVPFTVTTSRGKRRKDRRFTSHSPNRKLLSPSQECTSWFFQKQGWEVVILNFLVSQKQQKLLAELSKLIFFCVSFYLLHRERKGKIEEKAEICKELKMLPLSKRVLLLLNLTDSKGAPKKAGDGKSAPASVKHLWTSPPL